MTDHDDSLAAIEEHRDRLRAIGLRILGSAADTDDALQETWIRLERADLSTIDNLAGWLTTTTARICLNMLRTRAARREDGFDLVRADAAGAVDPAEALDMAESVHVALLVVLEALRPAERVAFVLHDLFAVPFDQVAEITSRTPAAARQLASRARRKVQSADEAPSHSLHDDHELVDAFYAAARGGDLDRLLALLDPDVILETTAGPDAPSVRALGATEVAGRALRFAQPGAVLTPVRTGSAAGMLASVAGRPRSLMIFHTTNGVIERINALIDPDRLAALDPS
jgi:RNA polymerase sigma-70 factor (ECF subfamily)